MDPNIEFPKRFQLLFIGSPLLDITLHCDQDTLKAYNLKQDNCVKWEEKSHSALLESVLQNPSRRQDSGGSAFNSAKIAKWVLGDKGNVAFSGCVGDDELSTELRNSLQASRVNPLFIPVPGQETGLCLCLISPGGERSMITRHGASAHFSTDHLTVDYVRNYLTAADCIFIVGYFAGHSPQVVQALAESCTSSQLFCLSLSAEYICREYTKTLLLVLPRVDVLVCNEAEMMALAEATCSDQVIKEVEDAVVAVKKLIFHDVRPWTIIVTRGANPVIMLHDNLPLLYINVPENVHVVDSVGCGDALAGALLAVYTLTGDMEKAVKAGIQAAVAIAQRPGCDPPSETFSF